MRLLLHEAFRNSVKCCADLPETLLNALSVSLAPMQRELTGLDAIPLYHGIDRGAERFRHPIATGADTMTFRFLAGLTALALVASCATLTEEECLQGNWREIGQRDGQAGRTASFIAEHAKACEKAGVVPNQSLWEQGRQAGLPAYCTPSKVYGEGRSGRGLSPVCPSAQLPALQLANDRGRAWYRLTNEMSSLNSEISELQSRIVKEDDRDRRARYLAEIRSLESRIRLLELRRMTEGTLI